MADKVLKMKVELAGLLMAAALLLSPSTSFSAAPALGPDCGAGASVVGSDSAGKVRLGTGVRTCTLVFASTFPTAPACAATNETNNGGSPAPVGARSTTTTLVIDGAASTALGDGDVVSYICVSY
jgi:hypothetical protein